MNQPPYFLIFCLAAAIALAASPVIYALVYVALIVLPYVLAAAAIVAALFVLGAWAMNGPGGKRSKGFWSR